LDLRINIGFVVSNFDNFIIVSTKLEYFFEKRF
jgi:hypothetical protein